MYACEVEMHTLSYLGEYLDGYLELGANLKVPSKSGGLLLGILADEGSHLQSLTIRNTYTSIILYYLCTLTDYVCKILHFSQTFAFMGIYVPSLAVHVQGKEASGIYVVAKVNEHSHMHTHTPLYMPLPVRWSVNNVYRPTP